MKFSSLAGDSRAGDCRRIDLASAADIASNVLSGFRLEQNILARHRRARGYRRQDEYQRLADGGRLGEGRAVGCRRRVSLEETAAAIGRLSDAGIQAEEAGTVLKTMLARLAAPTGKLEKLMTATGISVQDTSGKMLPA